ncbi:MAG: SoxR reducing system RseC family protein [Dissulfurispiraceae bacterium]|jgi:sigma-E factor negative regulatory protein RseC
MEEIGIVKEINGIRAVITVPKKGSCESCPGSSLCETLGAGEAVMEAFNHADARVGDTVKVVFRASTYLKGTILVYGLPSLMLIIGAVLGREYLGRIFPSANPDLASAAGGFGLFAFSFLILKLWSIFFDRKKEYMPIIEEIINRG